MCGGCAGGGSARVRGRAVWQLDPCSSVGGRVKPVYGAVGGNVGGKVVLSGILPLRELCVGGGMWPGDGDDG